MREQNLFGEDSFKIVPEVWFSILKERWVEKIYCFQSELTLNIVNVYPTFAPGFISLI